MTRDIRIFSVLFAFLLLSAFPPAAQGQSAAALPASAFGELPAIFDAAISPDGHKVVTAERRDGRDIIVVYDLEQGQPIYAANVADNSELRAVAWADDNTISFRSSATLRPGQVLPENYRFRGGPSRVFYARDSVIDLSTRRLRALSVGGETAWADQNSYLVAPIEGDEGFARMVGRAPILEATRRIVYRVNLATGESRPALVTASEDTIDYLFNGEGDVIVRIDTNPGSNRWRVLVYDSGGAERVLLDGVNNTGAPPAIVGALADGRLAALDVGDGDEIGVLYAIDRNSGESQIAFSREGYEVQSAIIDPWSRLVVGVSWTEVEDLQHFFEPALEAAGESVKRHFAGGSARIVSWSRDRSRILVYGENGLDGGGYYVLTVATNQLRRVGLRYPTLADANIGARQSIVYRARDGVRVPAYLTLPAMADAPRNLPTVVLVHGGPASRDDMNFDFWSTFLASRGYAVLQPNFRGSSGYGVAWRQAGHGEWGGLMQTDVEDGVAALVRSGIADASRVCIVGASYGGYAALAGATLTPDRYRCAASIAGPSDLNAFIRSRERLQGRQSITVDYWRMSIGDREEDQQRIREHSPANLADRVTIPILLMHGTDDTVVPITQSRLMEDRLRAAGKNVRFVELRGDDHWLSNGDTRTQMLGELEAFLAQNLGEQTR